MGDIPTPRSYNQILGDMASAFLARYPITNLKVGGPILSILEAAAQSDLRNTADIFKFLASVNLDSAEGTALDRILADEGTARLGAVPASGYVTVGDSRFTKTATPIYHGMPAPIIGSAFLYVVNAATWPSSGNLYIGRGTDNYEGPLAYIGVVNSGGYYTIALDPLTLTQNFHNKGEMVLLAQGGDRVISAGTLVRVRQGASSTPKTFSVLYGGTLLDGETSLNNIEVVSTQPGTDGNVPIGAISEFASAPFTGATVSNPSPFSNGSNAETDDLARTRIRLLRQAKSKGTASAIEAYLLGVVSSDESKRIASVKVLERENEPATAYIDDGTGYEEIFDGVPSEIFTSSAVGGEQYFQLSLGRPVAKAQIETTDVEPWNLTNVSELAVKVGGVYSSHQFNSTDFRDISNAAAYEIVHSINSDASVLFSARLSSGSQKVTLFAKSETSDDIEMSVPITATDANTVLRFPSGRVDTCKLYKNDVLLYKDGQAAQITSSAQSAWQPLADGDQITIGVDGTTPVTYTFNDVDFVNAGTPYNTVNTNNSLASWATVFNYKIPGITATVVGNTLRLSSNAGAVARGALSITGGGFTTKSVFAVTSSSAVQQDYTLNRNTGQLKLVTPLVAGESLTVGSQYTGAFLESSFIATTVTLTNGDMWFAVDGATQKITLPVVGSTTFTEDTQVIANAPDHLILACGAAQNIFADVIVGDWVVLTDDNFANPGAYRVSRKVDDDTLWMAVGTVVNNLVPFSLANNGLTVVRTHVPLQKVSITAGDYTAAQLAIEFTNGLEGAHGAVVRTGHVRVIAETRNGGDIMYVAGTSGVTNVPLTAGVLASAETSHNAYVESGNAENSTPLFDVKFGRTAGSTTSLVVNSVTPVASVIDKSDLITGLPALYYNGNLTDGGYDNVERFVSPIYDIATAPPASTLTLRQATTTPWFENTRVFASRPYCIGPFDDLSVTLDGDSDTKRYDVTMSRKVTGVFGNYAAVGMTLKDADNLDASLAVSFGDNFNFNDFALYMQPRLATLDGNYAPSSTISRFHWKEFGRGGEGVALKFTYPRTSNSTLTWSMPETTYSPTGGNILNIVLASGAPRNLATFAAGTQLGMVRVPTITGLRSVVFLGCLYVTAWSVVDHVTYSTVTLTVAAPDGSGVVTNHGFSTNDVLSVSFQAPCPLGESTITVTGTPGALTLTYDTAPAIPVTSGGPGFYGYIWPQGAPLADFSAIADYDVLNFSGAVWSDIILDNEPLHCLTRANMYMQPVYIPVNGTATNSTVTWSAPIDEVNTTVEAFSVETADTVFNAMDTSTWPVTMNVQGDPIYLATWVESLSTTAAPNVFEDGVNYIQTTTPAIAPLDYTFDLKNNVSALVAANFAWSDEDAYLVPLTAANVRDFINAPASSGLGQSSDVALSSRAGKLQITSSQDGGLGQVEVLGGTANEAIASIVGNAGLTVAGSDGCYVYIPSSELSGFQAGWWCELYNTINEAKVPLTIGEALVSIDGPTRTWVFNTGVCTPAGFNNISWQFERHGNYMVAAWDGRGADPATASHGPGDYIQFYDWASVGGPIPDTASASNYGTFNIIAYDQTTSVIWFENPNGVEERATASVVFLTRDSLMPGDTISVGSDLWGAGNRRTFTVDTVDNTVQTTFTTVETPVTSGAGADWDASVILTASSPFKIVKRLAQVLPHPTSSDMSSLIFMDGAYSTKLAYANGTNVKALSKFAFPLSVAKGKNGYSYNTGLIGEANRVLYGVENDTATYPGVVAAGSSVNISGPVVRRVQVSLGLRVRSGANKTSTFDGVRSAVATYINGLGVGVPVAISDIVAAANTVGGVEAVSVASPTYSTSYDQIAVQPYEKPLILQPDLDITLSLIG